MTAPVPEDKLRLGGMALRNGLLVHGPTHWAAAVRTDDGELKVASGRKPDLGGKASERLPGDPRDREARRGDGRDPARQARAAGGAATDAGPEDARRDGRRGARRAGDPHRRLAQAGHAHGRPRGRRGAREPRAGAARAAQRRPRRLPRRRAQVDRRIRGRRGRRRRQQGARPLRLPSGRADAHRGRRRQRGDAPGGAARPRGRGRDWARQRGAWRWRCSPGASAIPTRASRG